MSIKMDYIPFMSSYNDIRNEMREDLEYRLNTRKIKTSLGRPLYYRINLQVVMTHECPYKCPFCLERQNPMSGEDDFDAQIEALKQVLAEHPDARMSITGGEPGLYPEHVKRLVETFKHHSNKVFCSINTVGISTDINGLSHVNLSKNDYVNSEHKKFPGCTVQFVEQYPTLEYIKEKMTLDADNFSFRFMSSLSKTDYPVNIWNELQECEDIKIKIFRIGDFFVYTTFDYMGKHARVTLGDMWQQKHNDYKDGYSNIIIHPNGQIATNWR